MDGNPDKTQSAFMDVFSIPFVRWCQTISKELSGGKEPVVESDADRGCLVVLIII